MRSIKLELESPLVYTDVIGANFATAEIVYCERDKFCISYYKDEGCVEEVKINGGV